MGDGVWISIIGLAALGVVIWFIMRDPRSAPACSAWRLARSLDRSKPGKADPTQLASGDGCCSLCQCSAA